MRTSHFPALLLAVLLCSCGSNQSIGDRSTAVLVPAAVSTGEQSVQLFNAALPTEGEFNPTRVPAVSSLAKPGRDFHDASANVTAGDQDAEFAPAGASEFAIWRFAGTPDDSVGSIQVELSDGGPGTSYWIAVADYSTGRWDWIGHSADANDFQFQLDGSAGKHSSPAGYIYVAVLADSDVPFSVFRVTIEYLQRYDVSGVVLDMQDQPLGMALITTNLQDSQPVLSGPGGGFTLHGIPNGSWAVMVALDGYEFSPAMLTIDVADANVDGIVLRGNPQVSGWVGEDPYEPNNLYDNASDTGGSSPTATISILDDPVDIYRFPVPAQGWYYIQYEGDDSILFPSLHLQIDNSYTTVSSSLSLYGANWLGYYFPRSGNYAVELTCEGGGGEYTLSLHEGRTQLMNLYLGDDGSIGDGDDGLFEELYVSSVEIAFDDVRGYAYSSGTGTVRHTQIPPVMATLTPVSPHYTFDPPFLVHDFSTGPVDFFDFNVSAVAPEDPLEPNDDFSDASLISLPLAEPLESWIGGFDLTEGDSYDFYKFEVQGGKHLMMRVRFTDNGPHDYPSSGYLHLYDEAENFVNTNNYSGIALHERSSDPLAAGTYYLRVFMEGPLMPYELELVEFEPRALTVEYMLDGEALDFTRCAILTADQNWDDYESASDGLCEIDYLFMDGERVQVHHRRHGMVFDPAYEWVHFDGADILLTPAISPGTDSNEINDLSASAKVLKLPVDINASFSVETDYQDIYEIQGLNGEELEVLLEPVDEDIHSEFTVSHVSDNTQVFSSTQRGNLHCYLRAETEDDYRFTIRARTEGSGEYRLRIREATVPVYRISGIVDPGVAGEYAFTTYVVNHTAGIAVNPLADGSYCLGWYPAGSYQIEWQAANKSITPAGRTSVSLTTSDLVQDFSAVYVDNDFGEPNDSSSNATLLSIPASLHASLDDNNNAGPGEDWYDYYTFTASSDGILEVKVQPPGDWVSGFRVVLAEKYWSNTVNSGKKNPGNGEQLMRYPVTAGETYYVIVNNADDLEYDLTADYMN